MKCRMKFHKNMFYRVKYEKMLTTLFINYIRKNKAGIDENYS
jgi:hypothetical protein